MSLWATLMSSALLYARARPHWDYSLHTRTHREFSSPMRTISIMHNDMLAVCTCQWMVVMVRVNDSDDRKFPTNRKLSTKCFAIIICNTSASASALGGHSGLVIRRAQWRASEMADGATEWAAGKSGGRRPNRTGQRIATRKTFTFFGVSGIGYGLAS